MHMWHVLEVVWGVVAGDGEVRCGVTTHALFRTNKNGNTLSFELHDALKKARRVGRRRLTLMTPAAPWNCIGQVALIHAKVWSMKLSDLQKQSGLLSPLPHPSPAVEAAAHAVTH